MLSYLFKVFSLLIFSFFILVAYYFLFPGHIENFNGYLPYIISVAFFYGIYKILQLVKSKEVATFTPIKIVGLFLLNLLILCIFFFSILEGKGTNGLELFIKIIFLTLLPLILIFISVGFGNKIASYLPNREDFGEKANLLISIGLGFLSFFSLIVIFSILGIYNLYIIGLILIIFLGFSYKNLFLLIKKVFCTKYQFDIKEGSYIRLLSLEFFFLVGFIVLGIALISIYRPYPIGWDDLGVYMNYPHLIAESGSALSLGGMYTWQIFTGIGYMFKTPVAAFFINISGTFLSFIVLNIVFSDYFKSTTEKKSFLHLPSFLATLFVSLPMVVFQTSKDMKVDEGLFFITVILLYLLYKYFKLFREGKKIHIIYMLIIGLLAGLAFSIKFTVLLLIVGILGVISYSRIGIFGLFGYLSVIFGIFTAGNLWKIMNVLVNPNKIIGFEKTFGIISIFLGLSLLGIGIIKNKKNIRFYFKEIVIFLLGIFIAIVPWIVKNTIEIYPNISAVGIIKGKTNSFRPDLTSIYTKKEIDDIKESTSNLGKKINSVTTNEDLMRYFGYEKGILNFIKMPWNLTMQKNQGGEFTDIGFLFLALIPLIFIFLPYKNKYLSLFFLFFAICELFFFLTPGYNPVNTNTYSTISNKKLEGVFNENNYALQKKYFNRDIYDISFSDYINDNTIKGGIEKEDVDEKTKLYISELVKNNAYEKFSGLPKTKQTQESFNVIFNNLNKQYSNNFDVYYKKIFNEEFDNLKVSIYNNFYGELHKKVQDITTGDNLSFLTTPLSKKDFNYIKELNNIYKSTSIFTPNDIISLNEIMDLNKLSDSEKEIINKIWDENRTINGKMVDYFAKINLPIGYAYIFVLFFLPVLFLLLALDDTKKLVGLFKINLVFSGIYTFLWLISSFGIVWYGITMYFTFLLMIGIGAFYLSQYNDKENENIYLIKLVGSFTFLCIVSIYFLNSVIPHNFNNLKSTSFKSFKIGTMSQASSIFKYHNDYTKLLFTLNIKEDKTKEFLEENIGEDLRKAVPGIEKRDINDVFKILELYKDKESLLQKISEKSIERLYQNILNPAEEYKNKEKIYRIGTFLRYYISENNNRLLEDSLLSTFNNYIYGDNNSITVNRFKKLGVKYLLVDLNAATIDMSEDHSLTQRYEKLLSTFITKDLELIETDSICLKLGLDKYKQTKDLEEYMILAGVNYESYKNGEKIVRGRKQLSCVKFIDFLLEKDLVNKKDFPYLLPYKSYFEKNPRSIESINSIIPRSYKALFEIK